jgi:hypothetical protein
MWSFAAGLARMIWHFSTVALLQSCIVYLHHTCNCTPHWNVCFSLLHDLFNFYKNMIEVSCTRWVIAIFCSGCPYIWSHSRSFQVIALCLKSLLQLLILLEFKTHLCMKGWLLQFLQIYDKSLPFPWSNG